LHFLVDAQFPPALASRIQTLGHTGEHLFDCGLANAPEHVVSTSTRFPIPTCSNRARGVSANGAMLHLLKLWLTAPAEEQGGNGRGR
jgi:hypothetical protein